MADEIDLSGIDDGRVVAALRALQTQVNDLRARLDSRKDAWANKLDADMRKDKANG